MQVKVAQPLRGCGPPRRGASQASGPSPGPHFPLPGRGEVWGAGDRSHREPGRGVKEEAPGVSCPAGERGGGYGSQVPLSQPPEKELERLTKKLVHDMNHPPSGEYFGELTPDLREVGLQSQMDSGSGFPAFEGVDPVPPRPQAAVVAAEKTWSGMGPGLWPWIESSMWAALCVLRAGPSSGASISTPWRGGRIVRAAMW